MSIKLKEVAAKNGEILSRILKVVPKSLKVSKRITNLQLSSSSPNTSMIANIQERINNPLFELSIADYELMCGNKMMVRMMSKVLECDEKQLKKFCKYINVFKENINSSPKSIKNKMKSKMTLNKLPDDLLYIIVDKYESLFPTKYVLRNWIPDCKLNYKILSLNPKAIELLKANPRKIYWTNLSKNPNALELLKENPKNIDWFYLSSNTKAIELLRNKVNEENELDKYYLEDLDSSEKISWHSLSKNPNAIEILKANPKKIDWFTLSANPNAIEILKANPEKIDWFTLSANPNAIEILKANPEKIDWVELSGNPNAIELLKANTQKIDWKMLSANWNAIKLLRENKHKIRWSLLSANHNAIELLEENQDKIDWDELSGNPSIFQDK